jgi:hypothetical protein
MEWRSQFLGVPKYWVFPITGRSHGLAAAAPGHGVVALGVKKVALGPGPPGPHHFLRPKRHLAVMCHKSSMASRSTMYGHMFWASTSEHP